MLDILSHRDFLPSCTGTPSAGPMPRPAGESKVRHFGPLGGGMQGEGYEQEGSFRIMPSIRAAALVMRSGSNFDQPTMEEKSLLRGKVDHGQVSDTTPPRFRFVRQGPRHC